MGQILGFHAFWSCSVDLPHYVDPLAEIGHILGFWPLSGECVGVNVEGGGGGGGGGGQRLISDALHGVLSSLVMKKKLACFTCNHYFTYRHFGPASADFGGHVGSPECIMGCIWPLGDCFCTPLIYASDAYMHHLGSISPSVVRFLSLSEESCCSQMLHLLN